MPESRSIGKNNLLCSKTSASIYVTDVSPLRSVYSYILSVERQVIETLQNASLDSECGKMGGQPDDPDGPGRGPRLDPYAIVFQQVSWGHLLIWWHFTAAQIIKA
jgi:hypothetical protein